MKKIFTLVLLLLILLPVSLESQTLRNPVLEYCTGTWCQWCPCGATVISQNILPAIPNAIILGYHGPANGSDPFSFFPGNTILSSLGLSSYPTGIIDRTSAPVSRSLWFSNMNSRLSIPATVDISIYKTYEPSTRLLYTIISVTPLVNLSGQYKLNLVLTEDGLKYPQTGNSSCTGGADYVHSHVVRAMINGALGENINTNTTWNAGETISKTIQYTVPTDFSSSSCHLVAFVYKQNSPLNTGNIQQAKEWTLEGSIVPVEFVTFNASTAENGIQLNWQTATELNNHGFEIEKSSDGISFFNIGFVKGAGTTAETKEYKFIDNKFENEGVFYYRLKQVDFDGQFNYSDVISVLFSMPKSFSLGQNYPNPFNPTTTIEYSVAKESFISLKVYNILGKEVASLVNEVKPTGNFNVEFNASELSSGMYFVEMNAGNFKANKKILLVK